MFLVAAVVEAGVVTGSSFGATCFQYFQDFQALREGDFGLDFGFDFVVGFAVGFVVGFELVIVFALVSLAVAVFGVAVVIAVIVVVVVSEIEQLDYSIFDF